MNGIFITFEGPDGSGKTTQLKILAEYLRKQNYDVVTTREPGGTNIGDKIREILLNPKYKELEDQTEILLYASSRAQLVHEFIIPNLKKGKIVLCDRYIDASIAYQAYGLGKNRQIVEQINSFASSNIQANRTYLLHIDPEIAQKRLTTRDMKEFGKTLDRIEQKNLDYHKRVSNGFLQLAKDYPQRILKIDADNSIDFISDVIKNDFESRFKKGRRNE